MFRRACQTASEFVVPVILSRWMLDGQVDCSVGTAIVLNRDGWILTAAHMLRTARDEPRHQAEVAQHEAEVASIRAASGAEQGSSERIETLTAGRRQLVRKHSYWLGIDGWSVPEWHVWDDGDIAVGRLDGFRSEQTPSHPVFQAAGLAVGASLCRLGFPFYSVNATYDESSDRFELAPATLPIPGFTNEGILSRFERLASSGDLPFDATFIETSSAGLRGQSGGPVFDPDGHVWGVQVRTMHLPLGFDPELTVDGTSHREHQFMNVGVATASESVLAFLDHVGVTVATTSA